MDRERLTEAVSAAGVVGCGGAGFPTHVKFARKAGWFLVNGVECEPLLRSDRTVMRLHPGELVAAVETIARHLGAVRFGIALKDAYSDEIHALTRAIQSSHSPVELFPLGNFYPAGDEQMVVNQVTGRVVPPGGIPLDVDVVVSNAATVLAVHDALRGVPLIAKYVTVTGAVKTPVVLRTPVGTPVASCLEAAGGPSVPRYRVVEGGPFMGRLIEASREDEASVGKTTSGLVVFPHDAHLATMAEMKLEHMINRARSACIQCTQCTQMCPRNLLGHPLEPHRIMRALACAGGLDGLGGEEAALQSLLCSECGVCELFACPMGLQPRRINSLIKRALLGRKGKYLPSGGAFQARRELGERKIPTKRIASRTGILLYYLAQEPAVRDLEPDRIIISLKQGIGVPALPTVHRGDWVVKGQCLAICPQGQLGSTLHAGIDGRITRVDTRIVIERG